MFLNVDIRWFCSIKVQFRVCCLQRRHAAAAPRRCSKKGSEENRSLLLLLDPSISSLLLVGISAPFSRLQLCAGPPAVSKSTSTMADRRDLLARSQSHRFNISLRL